MRVLAGPFFALISVCSYDQDNICDPRSVCFSDPSFINFRTRPAISYTYCGLEWYDYWGKMHDEHEMEIDPGSKEEWEKQKGEIKKRLKMLQDAVEPIKASAFVNGWSKETLSLELGDLESRISGLKETLSNLRNLEKSTQVYALGLVNGSEGGTTYDTATGKIIFKIVSTENFKTVSTESFVHETTHGGQFEKQELGFSKTNSSPVANDVYDEVEAYIAQYNFNPGSIMKLPSTSVAKSREMITPTWVQNLTIADGTKPYSPEGSAHTGLIRINISSSRDDLIKAYPNLKEKLEKLPLNYTLKADTNVIYKH